MMPAARLPISGSVMMNGDFEGLDGLFLRQQKPKQRARPQRVEAIPLVLQHVSSALALPEESLRTLMGLSARRFTELWYGAARPSQKELLRLCYLMVFHLDDNIDLAKLERGGGVDWVGTFRLMEGE